MSGASLPTPNGPSSGTFLPTPNRSSPFKMSKIRQVNIRKRMFLFIYWAFLCSIHAPTLYYFVTQDQFVLQ